MKISIYIDTSGSMFTMGKDSALLYIAKSITDYCQSKSIESFYYSLEGRLIEDLPGIKYSNNSSLKSKSIQANSILLSDGLFETKDEKIFDISISIGIDADKNRLNHISNKVFPNDNVLMALEYLFFTNDLLEVHNDIQDEEDEW